MGGGAGQVSAGPLFCLVNEQIIFINERRVPGLTCLPSFSLSRYMLAGSDRMPVNLVLAANCDDVIYMNIIFHGAQARHLCSNIFFA